jgi:FdhE protein
MSEPARNLLLLERRVAALRKARPDLADALTLQEQLLRATLGVPRQPRTDAFALPSEAVANRVREGVPMLHDQPISLDINFAADLFSRLVNVLSERNEAELEPRLGALVEAATTGLLDPERLFAEAFVQHLDHLADMASPNGLDVELLATLALQAVAPLLRAYAEHLLPLVERVDDGTVRGTAWHHGYCPICGGWPLLGELRGVELTQWLRCSACGSGWRGQRLVCAYCAKADYRTLGTLAIDGEQRFRISVCERCKGYLKVGNAFDPLPAELLAIDDVASLHLDVAAMERGYSRPDGSGYRIELAVPEAEWLEELA